MTCDEEVARGPRGFCGRGGHKKNLPFLAAEGAAPDAFRRLKAIAEESFGSVFIELKLRSEDGVEALAKLRPHPPRSRARGYDSGPQWAAYVFLVMMRGAVSIWPRVTPSWLMSLSSRHRSAPVISPRMSWP